MGSMYGMVDEAVRRYGPNKLIVVNELYKEVSAEVKEQTFYKCLERMSKNGELVHTLLKE